MKLSYILILMLFVGGTGLAVAQGNTRVYLQQAEENDRILIVDVLVDNVIDLYGAQCDVTYDPDVLAVVGQVEPGNLLPTEPGKSFVVANRVQEAEGKITYARTLLHPTPAINGGGRLARITFQRLRTTPTTIDLTNVKLVSIDLQTIPSQTSSLSLGSTNVTVRSAPAPEVDNDFHLWIFVPVALSILAGGITVFSVAIIVLFIFVLK